MTVPSSAIREDLRAAGLLPNPLPGHSATNARGEAVDPTVNKRTADLDPEDIDFLREGGWTAVSIKNGEGPDGGITSHRGVLHPDEYVDHDCLVGLVEAELGFTLDQVHSVYRQGPLSEDQRELRGQIDVRLLALSRSGANITLLGRILGFPTTVDNTTPRPIKAALARARVAEEVAA